MDTISRYTRGLLALLPTAVQQSAIVAGGALRCFYDGTESNDVDLFFRSYEEFTAAVDAMSRHPLFRRAGDKGRTAVFVRDGVEYNLIGFAFGDPWATIARFDFRCCRMAAWLSDSEVLLAAEPEAAADAQMKRLVVLLNNGDARTERRIRHYVEDYGYRLDITVDAHCVGEHAPLLYQGPDPLDYLDYARAYIRRLPRCGDGGY